MKQAVEINMVVKDCISAMSLYESIFDVERLQVTNLPKGQNESIFSIYGTQFHLLDENPNFGLISPSENSSKSMWINITVHDIKNTYAKAIEAGCKEMQAVVELPSFGVSNAIFIDTCGYVWMIHQIHEEVSYEEMNRLSNNT